MNGSLDRVILVTGSSRGLGREIALAFGRAGEKIVINYRAERAAAEEVADQVLQAGGQAFPFKADVGLAHDVERLIEAAAEKWGRIDVLVNNAGRTSDRLLLRMSEQDWDEVLETNLKGCFHTIRSAAAAMTEQGSGHIINIASIVGIQGREGQANYAASKAGLIGLTKAAAKELGGANIQVNAVLPGYLATDMGGTVSGEVLDRIRAGNTLNRFSEPAEVARFIYHLSCMKNVSGQVFNLDSRVL